MRMFALLILATAAGAQPPAVVNKSDQTSTTKLEHVVEGISTISTGSTN